MLLEVVVVGVGVDLIDAGGMENDDQWAVDTGRAVAAAWMVDKPPGAVPLEVVRATRRVTPGGARVVSSYAAGQDHCESCREYCSEAGWLSHLGVPRPGLTVSYMHEILSSAT